MQTDERKVPTYLEAGTIYTELLQEMGAADDDIAEWWDRWWRFQFEVESLIHPALKGYTPAADQPIPTDVVLVWEALCNLHAFSGPGARQTEVRDCYEWLTAQQAFRMSRAGCSRISGRPSVYGSR